MWLTHSEYRPGGHYFTLYSQAPMATFRRLLGFLRPYRRAVLGSLVFAWLAMGDDGPDPVAGR